ncbi:MAG: hypothetical protein ABI378_04800, partial [Chitinophagaceae bacterium]
MSIQLLSIFGNILFLLAPLKSSKKSRLRYFPFRLKNVPLVLLCLASIQSYGQLGSLMYKSTQSTSFGVSVGGFDNWEAIYYPSDFVGMPKGSVTAVYIRRRFFGTPTNADCYSVKVRMKATDSTQYPNGGSIPAIMDTPLIHANEALVANYPLWTIDSSLIEGDWVKFRLNVNDFSFTGTQNIALQMSNFTLDSNAIGIIYEVDTARSNGTRFIRFANDSTRGLSANFLPMVGFEMAVTGVPGIKNLQSLGLFPNPSSGRFQLSFQSAKAVKVAHISVTDDRGKQVYRHSYVNVGT